MSRAPRQGMRAAVLGSPITHSLSPVLHGAAYKELGLDWTYQAIEVGEGGLAGFLDQLDGTWAGVSLTMPLKPEAAALARMRSDTVTATGAANTLVPLGAGWSAENTDVPGLVAALQEVGVGRIEGAGILGAGATAASAVVALTRLGATEIDVALRRLPQGAPLEALGRRFGATVRLHPWGADAIHALDRPVVVSTVPADAAAGLTPMLFGRSNVLFDAIYDPWPTPLAAEWQQQGGTVLGGLDLLVHQAVLQVELMTRGLRPSVATLRAAGLAALQER